MDGQDWHFSSNYCFADVQAGRQFWQFYCMHTRPVMFHDINGFRRARRHVQDPSSHTLTINTKLCVPTSCKPAIRKIHFESTYIVIYSCYYALGSTGSNTYPVLGVTAQFSSAWVWLSRAEPSPECLNHHLKIGLLSSPRDHWNLSKDIRVKMLQVSKLFNI